MTYLLGLAVLIVWGLIIYRIFNAADGSDDDANKPVLKERPKETYNDYAMVKDTTHLLLNYRDPFGLTKPKDTAEIPIKKLIHNTALPIAPKPVFNWNFIQYSGYIRNPGSKRLVTLVNINGKSETLTEGETKSQVHLLKNMKDSIKISYNGKTKFITMKSSAQ